MKAIKQKFNLKVPKMFISTNILQNCKYVICIGCKQINHRHFLKFKNRKMKQNLRDSLLLASSSINDEIFQAIQEYEDKIDHEEFEDQGQGPPQEINIITQKLLELQNKKIIKPVSMYKDYMGLLKQNREKKQKIKQLTQLNNRLKSKYEEATKNNQRVQQFMKEVECTFKNDHLSQKANQIMAQAKKTLYRQAKDSQNSIKKMTKTIQANSIQEYKLYLWSLEIERQRLHKLLQKVQDQNKIKRQQEDFNVYHLKKFHQAIQLINQIMENQMVKSKAKRKQYKSQKFIVSNFIKQKQIDAQKQQNQMKSKEIADLKLKKEGLQYQIEILKKKKKGLGKIKDQLSQFKYEIIQKQKYIQKLERDLKQKCKTHDYMTKWSIQLNNKLKFCKQEHQKTKKKNQSKINEISKQFEDWNRQLKNQLLQEEISKKKAVLTQLTNKQIDSKPGRKIRVIQMQEIRQTTRKISLYILTHNLKKNDFIQNQVLKSNESITLKELISNLQNLPIIEDPTQASKLARYIIQDNSVDYSRVDFHTKIQASLAKTIIYNLLLTELKFEDIKPTQQQLKNYLSLHYDSLRMQLVLYAGLSQIFEIAALRKIFVKRIGQQRRVARFTQMIQITIFQMCGAVIMISMRYFDLACQQILQKKLIKKKKEQVN